VPDGLAQTWRPAAAGRRGAIDLEEDVDNFIRKRQEIDGSLVDIKSLVIEGAHG
jgi:hypothetical protein